MYSLARKVLFQLPPERAHDFSLSSLSMAERFHLLRPFCAKVEDAPVEVMGLRFANPVGLAAGLDKNGDYFNALGKMGFGFVEIGTVTPKAQPGNTQPRMFRLIERQAIINRMGFNNKGVEYLAGKAQNRRFKGILGINIGKNKTTPEAEALQDYAICMKRVYPLADYIAVNISSPNTPGLRDLQFGKAFDILLSGIKQQQHELREKHQRHVPIAVKIAPDMSSDELQQVAQALLSHKIEGVIATNTTVSRQGVEESPHADEAGGLSGAPLTQKSTQTIKRLHKHLAGKIPIIGVGGIMTGDDAAQKIAAGASLVQIYSGFIYHGPNLITESVASINRLNSEIQSPLR